MHCHSENARDQRSLMVLAAILPDLRLLRELIVRRVDVNRATPRDDSIVSGHS